MKSKATPSCGCGGGSLKSVIVIEAVKKRKGVPKKIKSATEQGKRKQQTVKTQVNKLEKNIQTKAKKTTTKKMK